MVQIKTIDELEALYYGYNRNLLRKADAPITTSTAGVFNAIYGAYAWAQLNLEANAFGILPKYPWDKSGWRVITAKPVLNTASGNTVLGGTSEGGTIAETIKPTLQELDVRPKTAQLPFSASEVMEWLATHSRDDIWGGLGSLRLYMAVQHKEFLNRQLLADVEDQADTGGAFAGTKDFESLDRIVSSGAEEAALGGSGSGYYDPWAANATVDRDSGTTFDCTVESASGTIGTNGVLTDDTLRAFLRKIRIAAGKDPNVFLGSHEIYSEIQGLYMPSVRIPNPYGEALVQIDVNGIQTFKGTGVGIHVDSIYGIPFIPSKDAPSDTNDSSEVGRLFAFDTSDAEGYGYPRIGIQIAIPTEYYEATRRSPGYPFVNNAFVEKGVFRTMGETVCRHFRSQGKIRDIKL
jgi:hypothetical protein